MSSFKLYYNLKYQQINYKIFCKMLDADCEITVSTNGLMYVFN
jgi:hypothetical protein